MLFLSQGSLLANGETVDARSFRKETGYVMQSDALFSLLTVRETMRYAAYLRVQGKTHAQKDQLADRIISLLRLDKAPPGANHDPDFPRLAAPPLDQQGQPQISIPN